MKLAMNIRNWGPTATPEFLRACAEAADQSGLDAIWFNDHLGFPPKIENNEYGIPDDMGTILDPLGFATYLAACTQRIKFGTAVLILPYRPPIVTAKLLATIQLLSHGRFLLGVGPGYLEEEFRALGVSRKRRGRDTDDMIDFLHACAESELIEANGQPFVLSPKLDRPPIYIGGNQRGAEAGRGPLEVVAMKTLPLNDRAAAIDLAAAYRDAGVSHLVHTQGYDSPAQYAEIVQQIDGEIRTAL